MGGFRILGFAAVAALICNGAQARPYQPADDHQVLVRLPVAMAAAATNPAALTPDSAVSEAQALIEDARRNGDPRLLGRAEATLQPWWHEPRPPATVLLLRATLRQARHEFDAALDDLHALLETEPGHVQALLTQATVLRVQGRLAEAAHSCAQLAGKVDAFVEALCTSAIRGLRGGLAEASAVLDRRADGRRRQSATVRAWYAAERADMAQRRGEPGRAFALYAAAIAEGADDPLLRASMADLLLEFGRPAEALQIAGAAPQPDVLRLRRALALRALARPDRALEAQLADAYAAAHRRGDGAHWREEALFALKIADDPARALELARRNWGEQREPADALLLVATALAAGHPEEAGPVRDHVRRHGLEDVRLQDLLDRAGLP